MPNVRLLLVAALGLVLMHGSLAAQQQTKDQMAGTWALVSVDTVGADGARTPTYGPDPKGLLILDGSGHYSLQIRRASLKKIASNNRLQTTPEEDKAVVEALISHFGTYAFDPGSKMLTLHIDTSSFPNWDGTEQKRAVTFDGTEFKMVNPAASGGGGSAELVWRRLN